MGFLQSNKVFIGRRSHPVLLFFALTFVGVGMGGVWEMFEWVFDAMTVANSIKGKYDTMLDLVVDTAGAAVAAIMYIALHWGTD